MSRLAKGARIDGYEVLGWVGAGPTADVYLACDLETRDEVTLKVLRSQFQDDAQAQKRFAAELEAPRPGRDRKARVAVAVGEYKGCPYQVWRTEEFAADRTALLPVQAPVTAVSPPTSSWKWHHMVYLWLFLLTPTVVYWYVMTRPPGDFVIHMVKEVHAQDTHFSWVSEYPCYGVVEFSGQGQRMPSRTKLESHPTREHDVHLDQLCPGSQYSYRIGHTYHRDGHSWSWSKTSFFTTRESMALTRIVETTTSRSVTIHWFTNLPSRCTVSYGSTRAYGTDVEPSGQGAVEHRVVINRLTPGETVHFRITATDTGDPANRCQSEDRSFRTPGEVDPNAPTQAEIERDPLVVLRKIASLSKEQRAEIHPIFLKRANCWEELQSPKFEELVADPKKIQEFFPLPAESESKQPGRHYFLARNWVKRLARRHPRIGLERQFAICTAISLTNPAMADATVFKILRACYTQEFLGRKDVSPFPADRSPPVTTLVEPPLSDLIRALDDAGIFRATEKHKLLLPQALARIISDQRTRLRSGDQSITIQKRLGVALILSCDLASGGVREGCEILEGILRSDPAARVTEILARGYLLTDRPRDALDLLGQYRKRHDLSPDSHVTLGLAYDREEDPTSLARMAKEWGNLQKADPERSNDVGGFLLMGTNALPKMMALLERYLAELDRGPMPDRRMRQYLEWFGPDAMPMVSGVYFPSRLGGCHMAPDRTDADPGMALMLMLPLVLASGLKRSKRRRWEVTP